MRKNHIFALISSLGLACLLLAGVRPSSPQDDEKWLPNQVGKWKPSDWMMASGDRADYQLTQRESDIYVEKTKLLVDITREPKVLNPPLGIDAVLSSGVLSPPYSSVQKPRSYVPVRYLFRLRLIPYFASGNGQMDTDPDNAARITFYINDLDHIFSGERYTHKGVVEDWVSDGGEPAEMEDEQGLYYLAPRVTGDLQGFPIYDTDAVILVKSQKPLWVPVSQERFLRNSIRRAEEIAKKHKEEQETMLNEPLPQDPELARSMKEAQEEGKKLARESEAATRAQLAEFPGNIRFLYADYVQALTKELSSLSPAERAAPAYYSPDWKTARRPSGLLDPAAPAAQPVVSPNPDFFDPALPRTTMQVIVALGISSRDRAPAQPEKANPAAVRFFEVRNSLDWKKLAALLE